MSQSLRRWIRRFAVGATALLSLLVAVLGLLQLPAVATWSVRLLTPLLPLAPGYRLDVARVSGDWLHGLELANPVLRYRGRELVSVERLVVRYDLRGLGGEPRIAEVLVAGARVQARREGSTWDLAEAFRRSAGSHAGGRAAITVDRIELRKVQLAAQLAPGSIVRARNLSLEGHALALGSPISLIVDDLAGAVAPPGSDRWLSVVARGSLTSDELRVDTLRIRAAGTSVTARAVMPRDVARPGRLQQADITLGASPVALADVAGFVREVDHRGALWLDVKASGAARLLRVHVSAGLDGATLALDGSVPLDRGRPAGYRGKVAVRRLDPSRLLRGAPTGDVSGTVDADFAGTTPDSMWGRIRARLGNSRIATTDLRRLDLRADLEAGRADLGVDASIGGVAVHASGWARPFDSVPSYRLEGSSHDFPGGRALARALAGGRGEAALASRFRVTGTGLTPTGASLSGSAWLTAVRPDGESVSLGETRVRFHHGRLVAQPQLRLRDGSISALAIVRLGPPVSYEVRQGRITRVNLGSLIGDTLVAPLSGRFTVSGRGLGPREAAATLRLDLDRPGYGGFRVDSLGGTVQLRGGAVRGVLRGAVQRGGIAVDLDARPFDSPASLTLRNGRADSLDLGALLGRPALRTSLNARFTASARRAQDGSRSGGLTAVLLPSQVGGVELRTGRLSLTVGPRVLVGTARLGGPDGEIVTRFQGDTRGASKKLEADGTVRFEHLARWSGRPDLDGRLEGRFDLRGGADSSGVRSVGGTVTASGGIGALRLDPIHIAFTPEVDVLRLDTLIVRSNVATLSGAGCLALRGSGGEDSLRVLGQLSDPAPLATILGLETASLDSGRLALTVAGTSRRRRLDGEADVHGLLVGDKLAGRLTIRAGGLLAGPNGPDIAAAVRVENGAYGRLVVRQAQLSGRYGARFALSGTAALDDSLRVAMALTGTLGDTVRARLQRLDIGKWSLQRPADITASPRIAIDHLALRDGGRRLRVDGVLDRRGASDLTARFDSVELGLLRELGLPSVPGRLDGSVHLAGTPRAPAVDGNLTLTVLPKGRHELGRIRTALTWRPAGLHIDASAAPRRGGRLSVKGTLPLRVPLLGAKASPRPASDSVAIAMRADGFDLAFLAPLLPPDQVSSLRGRLALQGRIGGTLEAPHVSGTLALSQVGLTLPGTGLSYRQGTLTGRLDGDHLGIDRLDILTGKKQGLTARGTLLLRPLDDPSLDLSAELRGFRIANTAQLQTAASGPVRLIGTLAAPVVTGRVQLGPTDVFTGGPSGPAVQQVQLSAEDLRLLARQFGPAAIRRAHARPALLRRVRLALDLDMPSRVWIRRRIPPTMDIELQGKARLRQDPGGPMQLFGSVQPVLGTSTLAISGRTFRLTGGTIHLDGPVDSANLDVNAEYQAPTEGSAGEETVNIDAEARGTPDSVALSFTSDPSMSQEDILAYIVSGSPASGDPLAGSRVAGEAVFGEQLAVSQVSGVFSRRVAQGLGFDVFDVQPDVTYGLTLTAGRYLTSRLFAEMQLPLQGPSSSPDALVVPVGPSFELDYRLRRWISAGVHAGSVPPGVSLRGQRVY